jgi:hypothetical protein
VAPCATFIAWRAGVNASIVAVVQGLLTTMSNVTLTADSVFAVPPLLKFSEKTTEKVTLYPALACD